MTDSEYELKPLEEPSKPKPPAPPGGYLPRLTYKPPEPDPDDPDAEASSEDEAGPSVKKPRKTAPAPRPCSREGRRTPSRPAPSPVSRDRGHEPAPVQRLRPWAEGEGGSPKKVLKEDTPEFDTYETRKKSRLVVGLVAGLCVVFAGWRIVNALRPVPDLPPLESVPNEPFVAIPGARGPSPAEVAAQNEPKAKALLEEARQYALKGKGGLAVTRLELVKESFKNTKAAEEAQAALDRMADGFPLFPGGPVVQASEVGPEEETTVSAEQAQAQATAGAVAAQVQTPEAPPEPEPVAAAEPSQPVRKLLPEGFHARPGAGLDESGWPREILCDRDHSTLVFVPEGTYLLGNNQGPMAERPQHKVTLSAFYIDRHEVTDRQMQAFREATGTGPSGSPEAPELPAVNVTLAEARAYAEWAGKSVPSEAQWEAAARSADARLYPWGQGKPAWSRPRRPRQIDPVMSFPADQSPCGGFDFSGNAWEWTNDIFSTSYYDSLKGDLAVDPSGPDESRSRIVELTIKGGSSDWDLAWRSGMRPTARLPYLGFRCVLKVGQPPEPPPGSTAPQAPPDVPRTPDPTTTTAPF